MSPSLSIVLPVFNLERLVRQLVEQAVEASAELTDRFEVLVIDNGSTDMTGETVHELAIRLPQVRLLRLPMRRRRGVVIDVAMSRTMGEVVFLGDDLGELEISDIHKMWQAIQGNDIVVAYGGAPPAETLRERWSRFVSGRVPHAAEDTFQMVRRETIVRLQETFAREIYTIDELEHFGLRWAELTVRRRIDRHPAVTSSGYAPKSVTSDLRPRFHPPERTRQLGAIPALPPLESFTAVRDFALGE
ncbi:MAG: glycosyltransferase [Pirellulales bacterium]|nr:glycosyltransferase [Planctomycetales bacterium]